jgi:alginate O-acetyltransferase complex protein AlgI
MPLLALLYFLNINNAWRRGLLILFSLAFYAWGEPTYVLLMLVCVLVNFIFGLEIGKSQSEEKSKRAFVLLITAVAVNLSFLIFFKYAAFFIKTVNLLPGIRLAVPEIALPVGISFFTFQSMSYTIDVYRGDAAAQRSFSKLLLYVSLFPQLIAGPIVRYKDIESQLDDRGADISEICEGMYRFACGLAKKVLIANPCGAAADTMLSLGASEASVISSWFGALFFALQIYYDFSGYSDMAIGLGGIFGFRFRENFDYPYISRSVTEFWRRWHISLGTFFRDYLYIPLGGNRQMWVRNVLIVWLLTGMWHGTSWNFIAWGLFYALLLLAEKRLSLKFSSPPVPVAYIYMFIVNIIGWTIFYYTDSFLPRVGMLFGYGGIATGDVFDISIIRNNFLLLCVAIILSFPVVPSILKRIEAKSEDLRWYSALRIYKIVFTAGALLASTVMLAGNTYNPFLYFRF